MADRVALVRARWWLCIPTTFVILALVDVAIALFWHPNPSRLPEQFSASYLERYVDLERGRHPVVFLGDSVLWGYRLPAGDVAAELIARDVGPVPVLNLSYEGGSSANSYFVLRYLLSRGIVPRAIVLGINSKVTNVADSAYRRLQPSVETAVLPLLSASDRHVLDLSSKDDLPARLDRMVADLWTLYRYRTDLREQFFGTDDASLAVRDEVRRLTGSARLEALAHSPTADKFLGTYDLSPIAADNVDAIYLRKLAALIERERIPAVAFLTPANHALLHDYIDDPAYAANVAALARMIRRPGTTVLDLDRAIPAAEFIDNDHLTEAGNRRLAALLLPAVRKAVER
ncbi:MAG: hypothetical protein M3R30_10865 [Candidatus Eremiobacteraeota bacterium]|nr:hypothetical protein [Candidatus Eremiobacteraeota bacterium]